MVGGDLDVRRNRRRKPMNTDNLNLRAVNQGNESKAIRRVSVSPATRRRTLKTTETVAEQGNESKARCFQG